MVFSLSFQVFVLVWPELMKQLSITAREDLDFLQSKASMLT